MRKILKIFLATVLAVATALALCAPASAVYASDCGLKVVKKDTYTKDGKFYIPFTITGGKPYEAWSGSTFESARLVNSSGKSVFSWSEDEIANGKTVNRNYGANWSNLPSGTYTFILKLRVAGYSQGTYGVWYNYYYEWKYNFTHTQPAVVNLKNVEVVTNDDGTYSNKLVFSHSGAKGLTLNVEVYDQKGAKVYSRQGSNPISYDSGTYNFYWNGYPSGGGLRCSSGTYTIKYWLGGKNAKQTSYYLSIY